MFIAAKPIPVNRKQRAVTASMPPPVGGLNARDPWADMEPQDAITLTNIFPENNYVAIRRGHAEHSDTGTGDPVRTLMTYAAPSGNQVLIAAAGGGLFDVTASATALVASGLANDDWQYVNFTTPGGHYLQMVNGASTAKTFNGTAIADSAFTASGITSANLVNVAAHKERLWFVQEDSLTAWYGGTQAIAGALSRYPLGSFCELGGRLLAAGTISTTAGISPDDYLCFVTDQGEVLIYQGTDPASATTWALAERLRIGTPIGYRCLVRIGGDLVVITTEGAISIRKSMEFARGQQDRAAVTDKIRDLFNTAARSYSGNFGWMALVYPKARYVVFNIPVGSDAGQYQFVMNSVTGAWCKFTGMSGPSWALLDDDLYFGGNDGKVYLADTGFNDNGAVIIGLGKTAFNYLGRNTQQKFFTMLRPIFQSNGSPGVGISLSTDFGDTPPGGNITPAGSTAGVWGTSDWGTGVWGGETRLTKDWQTVGALGYCGAVGFRVEVDGQSCRVLSFDLVAQPGGVL